MSARRAAHSHVVARVQQLDAATRKAGYTSRRKFAASLHRWPGAPGRATVLNLWLGNVIGIDKAEVVALALGIHVGDIFELSNGRRIER